MGGYDTESRLISASQGGNTIATYAYDTQGNRKSKSVGTTATITLAGTDKRAILDYDGTNGQILRWYAFGSGPNDVLNQMNVTAGTRATFVPDIQGSVLASLDSGSGTLTKAGYQPYGESPSTVGTFRYTGARVDAETNGLYDFRARIYSPMLGRFMQADPIGTNGGYNLYAYVGNDPLNALDLQGLIIETVMQSAASQAASFFNSSYVRTSIASITAQPLNDIGQLLRHPGDIPNAIASVAPALTPIAGELAILGSALGSTSALTSTSTTTTSIAADSTAGRILAS